MKLRYSRIESLLEIAAAAAILAGGVLLFKYWSQLPPEVPRHFDFRGTPDGWGGKGMVPALFVTELLLYLFLTLIRIFGPRFSKKGSSQRSLSLAMELLTWSKAAVAISFTYLLWSVIAIALGRAAALAPLFMPLFIGLTLAVVGLYTVLIFRAEKEAQQDH